jgi:hypothetical protein
MVRKLASKLNIVWQFSEYSNDKMSCVVRLY